MKIINQPAKTTDIQIYGIVNNSNLEEKYLVFEKLGKIFMIDKFTNGTIREEKGNKSLMEYLMLHTQPGWSVYSFQSSTELSNWWDD